MPTDLKPCPNPKCRSTYVERVSFEPPDEVKLNEEVEIAYFRLCKNCEMTGPVGYSYRECDEFWNALPRDPTDEQKLDIALRVMEVFDSKRFSGEGRPLTVKGIMAGVQSLKAFEQDILACFEEPDQ